MTNELKMTTDIVKTELPMAKATESNPVLPAMLEKPPPSVAEMFYAALDVIKAGSLTSESVAAVGEAMKLCERMEDREAEKAFVRAFVPLQAEMPGVQATRPVPNRDGSIRYKFAPFEDLMEQVGPMLQKHGFTVTFSSRFQDGRTVSICTLQHIGGHKRTNEFAVRIGQGPPGATESQADGSAATYAKRFALIEALNIVVTHIDNDARMEGGPITKEQAEELARRVAETNSDKEKFLKFAGAKSFAEIPSAKYSILDNFLSRKEKG